MEVPLEASWAAAAAAVIAESLASSAPKNVNVSSIKSFLFSLSLSLPPTLSFSL